jgi:hypothetical protein
MGAETKFTARVKVKKPYCGKEVLEEKAVNLRIFMNKYIHLRAILQ